MGASPLPLDFKYFRFIIWNVAAVCGVRGSVIELNARLLLSVVLLQGFMYKHNESGRLGMGWISDLLKVYLSNPPLSPAFYQTIIHEWILKFNTMTYFHWALVSGFENRPLKSLQPPPCTSGQMEDYRLT